MQQTATPEQLRQEAQFIDQVRRQTAHPHIAFIGRMGSGKTTAADYLVHTHGYAHLSFADKLKQAGEVIWTEDIYLDRDKLQKLGVAVRGIEEDAWVNALFRTWDRIGPDFPVVIDDCRFPNEYQALKERDFVFVRLYADDARRVDRLQRIGKLQDLEQLNHESEQYVDHFDADYTISNTSDLELFHERIENTLRRVAMRA